MEEDQGIINYLFEKRSKQNSNMLAMLDFCRVCRSESTPDHPLYHPCKCSGSIRFVHEDW